MGGWLVLVLIGRGIVKDIVDLYVMLWEVTRLQSFKDKESFGTKTRRPGKCICSPAPAPALPLLPGSRQAHVVRPRGQPLHLPGGQVSSMMTGQVSGVRYDDKSGAHLGKEGCGELLLVPGQAYPYLQVV